MISSPEGVIITSVYLYVGESLQAQKKLNDSAKSNSKIEYL